MKTLSHAPRPPINQGIDTSHPVVKYHEKVYNAALESITEDSGVAFTLNPYGTAPLTGHIGVWLRSVAAHITVRIRNDIGAIPVSYAVDPRVLGPALIPVVGLVPGAMNYISVVGLGHDREDTFNVMVPPLPLTDAELAPDPTTNVFTGFPKYEVTIPAKTKPMTIDELYFTAFCGRYNVGVDSTGMVRWYTTLDIPAFNIEKLANGHFISSDFHNYKKMFEFDLFGRVHTVYNLDNNCHHSIWAMADRRHILVASEYTSKTEEDGLSIIDLETGLETAYYDIRNVLDLRRRPQPYFEVDWLHINQSYLNDTNNLLVTSGRHQCVFAINADTSELAFILATHVDWSEEFAEYLLTPVDASGNSLYDLSDPNDIDKADKEFWPWAQHAVLEIPNPNQGIVEFLTFDNGNFRSRDEAKALIPNDNYSRIVHYKVDLSKMTVQKVYEYGKTEVGNRGYSAYVCNEQILNNGNYFLCFGGVIIDENGRITTPRPGSTDIVDPLAGNVVEGNVVLQEINPSTSEPEIEFTCSSGRYKTLEADGSNYRVSFYAFRSFKWSLLP